jgi:hypothetical protein
VVVVVVALGYAVKAVVVPVEAPPVIEAVVVEVVLGAGVAVTVAKMAVANPLVVVAAIMVALVVAGIFLEQVVMAHKVLSALFGPVIHVHSHQLPLVHLNF